MSVKDAIFEELKKYGLSNLKEEHLYIDGGKLIVEPTSNFKFKSADPYLLSLAKASKGEVSEDTRDSYLRRLFGLWKVYRTRETEDLSYEQFRESTSNISTQELAQTLLLQEGLKGININPEKYKNFLESSLMSLYFKEIKRLQDEDPDLINSGAIISYKDFEKQLEDLSTEDMIELLICGLF
jgi:hypothetical protein